MRMNAAHCQLLCSAFDVTMGGYLAWRVRRRSLIAATPGG